MLKIAEYNKITGKRIELSELERFGFKIELDDKEFDKMDEDELFEKYYHVLAYRPLGCHYYLIVENDECERQINVVPRNNVPFKVTLSHQLDVLYDLIEAGYVEKVE